MPSKLGLGSPATLPLLTTSLTLFYALVEPTIFIPFLRAAAEPDDEESQTQAAAAAANRAIRKWWTYYLPYGLSTIFALGMCNAVAGIYALRQLPTKTRSLEWKICCAGLVASLGHFAFGGHIAGVIRKICDEEVEREGETANWLREWLKVHALRTALTDAPAVGLFAWVVFRA